MGQGKYRKKRKMIAVSPSSPNTPSNIAPTKSSAPQTVSAPRHLPWKRIMAGILGVMTVIGFWNDVFGLRERLFPLNKDPIVLSSERIDLGSGSKKSINNFLVRNIGEIDLYQVTIKLLLESTVLSVTNDDICVEMVDVPKNMEMPIPGDSFNQVLVADHGFVIPGRDFNDCPGLWIVITHLPPKAYTSFRIRNQSFKILPPGEHSMLASVVFFTNNLPATFMFDDGSPGFMSGPRSDSMGMKSSGPGMIRGLVSMHTSLIDGADIVTNATSLMNAGKWEEAEKELTRAIKRNPSLGVAYANRSAVLLRMGRAQDAYQDCLKATSLLPDDASAHANFAQCLRLLGRNGEALTSYNRAIVIAGTNSPVMIYQRGATLNDLNRPVEARKDFDHAILLGYTNELVHCCKGIAFLKELAFSNAIVELNVAIAMRPDMADAYFARGLAFGALNQFGVSDRDLREAIRLRPSYEETLREMKKTNQVPEDTARRLTDPQR